MTQPQQPIAATFTREDLSELLSAHQRINDFEKFVLARFADYTRFTAVSDDRGRPVAPIIDAQARTSGGYGQWRVAANWATLLTSGPAAHSIRVEHYLAHDRGPGQVTSTVRVPLKFIFGEMETDTEYAEFLRLKAIYEPGGTEEQVEDVVAYGAAQRLLDVLPADERIPVQQMLTDKAEAARIYRTALAVAESAGEGAGDLSSTSRLRSDIHAHAAALGLDLSALRDPEPSRPETASRTSRARLRAARVLLLQAPAGTVATSVTEQVVADPANRATAAVLYRAAIAALFHRGISDVRRDVHAAAQILGLNGEDLRSPRLND